MDQFLQTRFNVVCAPQQPSAAVLDSSSELLEPLFRKRARIFESDRAAWLTARVRLFERFCLPSVAAQSKRDFTWLVYFDEGTPTEIRDRIEGWRQRCPQLLPVYTGSFGVKEAAWPVLQKGREEWIITTRLDSDDAIHRDFLKVVAGHARPVREALNVTHGYHWFERAVFPYSSPSNMFVSLVERRDSALSVLAYRHTMISKTASLRQIKTGPFFISVIHDASLSKEAPKMLASIIPEHRIAQAFSIDRRVKL